MMPQLSSGWVVQEKEIVSALLEGRHILSPLSITALLANQGWKGLSSVCVALPRDVA